MQSYIYVTDNLTIDLSADFTTSPALNGNNWSDPSNDLDLPEGQQTEVYWVARETGGSDGDVWTINTVVTVGGSTIDLQVQVTWTITSSDIAVQIGAGSKVTGWQSEGARLRIAAADGNIYVLTANFVTDLEDGFDDVVFTVALLPDAIMPQIDHVVVLMMENRSLDNLLGWIYPNGAAPAQVLPASSAPTFDGLSLSLSNSDPTVNGGQPVNVTDGTTCWWDDNGKLISEYEVPNPDPGEEFEHVNTQLGISTDTSMQGFLTDYATQEPGDPAAQIMQCYSLAQVPVISTLATSFAVSDCWFASVPTQTWPNRGFVQTGSSDGHLNNDDYEPYDINTVFDVFTENGLSWMVYNDGSLPSLTRSMFIAKYANSDNFTGIGAFRQACSQDADAPMDQKLPAFSFVEPNFGVRGKDQSYHPPHDVRTGDKYLKDIYHALCGSPYRDNILFIVLFDEHGGTYDHVTPPDGAEPPEPSPVSRYGNFHFNRFGVRVPAIFVSSWVTPGTVFRSETSTPLDHTSVLATLRDWQGLSTAYASMLPSPRIMAAPNLAYVQTETEAQSWPTMPNPAAGWEDAPEAADDVPLNAAQIGVLLGASALVAGRPLTTPERKAAIAELRTQSDGRAFVAALQPHLPLR